MQMEKTAATITLNQCLTLLIACPLLTQCSLTNLHFVAHRAFKMMMIGLLISLSGIKEDYMVVLLPLKSAKKKMSVSHCYL